MAQYALVNGTNTFVEAGSLGQAATDQGLLIPPSSKRARVDVSPAVNGILHLSSSCMPSEQDEEAFLPPSGPPKKGVTK